MRQSLRTTSGRRAPTPSPARATDPRIARSHAAVMDAARSLLVEGGPEAMTVDAVVARSGVAKTTVYRHWATRDDLVVEVLRSCAPRIEAPGHDLGFEEALRLLTRRLVEALGDEHWRRIVPALMLLRLQHSDVARLDDQLKEDQHEVFISTLRLGVQEGVLDRSALDEADRMMTLLVGPVLMAALIDSTPLTEEFADKVTDQFLGAARKAG